MDGMAGKFQSLYSMDLFSCEEDGSIFITPIDDTMPQDYDCRTRDWYQKAANNRDKAVWTDPYLDAGEIGGYATSKGSRET